MAEDEWKKLSTEEKVEHKVCFFFHSFYEYVHDKELLF